MEVKEQNNNAKYYEALVNRDPSFIGIFYAAIKTTGIFCIATCRARKPRFENVEFFTDFKEALKFGYRPCKICCPTEHAHQMPVEVQTAIAMVKKNPEEKVSDYDLYKAGIQPEKVRRWFKLHYNLTFQAYQRMVRINTAVNYLQHGERVTSLAFGSGYESLSGFGYTFKKLIGHSPLKSKSLNMILMDRFTTPLGPMYACSTSEGICLLEFTDRRMLETEFVELETRLRAKVILGENDHLKQLKQELQEYFEGTRTIFTVKLDTPGSDFQKSVWKALLDIPYGKTVSYMDQAMVLKAPKAIRAVASANGQNRIAIVIPCHRVIGSDGSLTGYAGGLERKRWLLEHELKHSGRKDLLF